MSFFNQPLQIKNLSLKNRVFLAPLAGVSDIPFRRVCQEMGAGLTYVEMLSATAIFYKNKRTFEMMARHCSESVLGVQVTGPNAEQVCKAIEILDKQGFDTIDINMGCPVRKVVSAGCGSAILKEPERISTTVACAREVTSKPLSAKIRLGFTREEVNVDDSAYRISSAGADMLTIHGRTRSESYSTPCDLEGIKKGLASTEQTNASLIKVGNGDLFSVADAFKMRSYTQCDAVMVSRGALGNPWIFKEILQASPFQPHFEEWLDLVLRHLEYQKEYFGNTRIAAILFRKHLLWYAKGFPNMRALRERLNSVQSLEEAQEILKSYAQCAPKALRRFSDEHRGEGSFDPKYEMHRELDRGVGEEGMQ
ncbi:MAG: tRNA dihydrouridine synthase DusB [Silvanigrellaceae bacterium]|nr:tRNA dihydrouridine synthase DusB [Silvanigrellaceae bacterium]